MYRHLGGRFLLLASGATGAADLTGAAKHPPAVDLALTLLSAPVLVELVVALGLLAAVVVLRARRAAVTARRLRNAPLASGTSPTR